MLPNSKPLVVKFQRFAMIINRCLAYYIPLKSVKFLFLT